MRCAACATLVADSTGSCPSCGAPLVDPQSPTLAGSAPPPKARTPSARSPSGAPLSSSTSRAARFVPGTVLAERYRIVAALGRGGMGEVYRADDLKLDQAVALKFLPDELLRDPAALERFHREVRVARQVSHPNVCRVFDVGEVEGQQFLSMEYIDGEDLASLLRRIGRLPPDKALEIARQLCAGLAAAHDAGVIHRDLKPANVMIDGRGRARLTDFGLAGLTEEFQNEDVRAGTPAYMAPEQLAGKEVTVRSDIFSLGLVLYELFTGKCVFEAKSPLELMRLHERNAPSSLVSLVKDLDPAIERAILRCMAKDPRARPASALQVAAALPGGDPLAAALAAGETPSPELVAAAGGTEGLRPGVAWACLLTVVLATAGSIVMGAEYRLFRRVELPKSPAVLAQRAQEIVEKLGHTGPVGDTAYGITTYHEFLDYLRQRDQSAKRWEKAGVQGITFWYRSSPRPLEPLDFLQNGQVTAHNPALKDSGMTLVWLDSVGRLTELIVVPNQVEGSPAEAPRAPDWAAVFAEAGLHLAAWTPVTPEWTPPTYADTRAAWTGSLPDWPEVPLRIEAAAYRGKPVYFQRIGPWSRIERMQDPKVTQRVRAANVIVVTVFLGLLLGALLLARRNLRLGRGDQQAATRVAVTLMLALMLAWLLTADHVPNFTELGLFVMALGWALFLTGYVWVLYVALEPYVRRRWPVALVSWSRVLAGKFRDPVVGRDVLLGCVAAALVHFLDAIEAVVTARLGLPPQIDTTFITPMFLGAPVILARTLNFVVVAVFVAMLILFLFFLLRLFLRRDWAAAAAFVLLSVVLAVLQSETPAVSATTSALGNTLLVLLLLRFGLLSMIAAFLFDRVLHAFPITTDFSAWYAGIGLVGILLTAALALYGFYASLGGRPVFGTAALDD